MSKLLEVTAARAGYGGREVLHDVAYSLDKGELCMLLGANGSGKSTLLKAICGLIPAGGSCTLNGEELWDMSRRRRAQHIGYLAQRGGVSLSLSALDVVLMGYSPDLGLLERPGRTQIAAALAVMEELDAAQYADKDFLTLSEGQRQLVLFARTLVRRPPLLVLDEPDSALDPLNRRRVLGWLKRYAAETGAGVLLCSHDANLALRYADRLLLLREGRLDGNIVLTDTGEGTLAAALSRIYGPVEVLRHKGTYLMTGGEDL